MPCSPRISSSADSGVAHRKSFAQKDAVVDNRLAAVAEIGNLGVHAKDLVPLLEKLADDDLRLAVREAAKKAADKIKGL